MNFQCNMFIIKKSGNVESIDEEMIDAYLGVGDSEHFSAWYGAYGSIGLKQPLFQK